jgi:mevalonate kinase
MDSVTTSAPAKAILFGEHAVNRGQSAIAVGVGLRLHCTTRLSGYLFHFQGAGHARTFLRDEITSMGAQVDAWREQRDYQSIRELAFADYFAPAKYILAHAMRAFDVLGDGLDVDYASDIPNSGGLGSGGAANVALSTALAWLVLHPPATGFPAGSDHAKLIGDWAYLGDIVAHGGIASALDTQTSLLGGVVYYTSEAGGERIPCAPDLYLVVGDTGIRGQTSEVNARVREWVATDASHMRYFDMIGEMSAHAMPALANGDWTQLGRLMSANQLVLEKIGVSCPELDRLIAAAMRAGALGAKLSGSGGGGIMIALVTPETRDAVIEALTRTGATSVYAPEVAVQGAEIVPRSRT